MFTGIVQNLADVISFKNGELEISTSLDLSDCKIGSSICCIGVCLTVTEINFRENQYIFLVNVGEETQKRTNFSNQKFDKLVKINIEKSLKMLKEAYSKNPNSHHILDSLAWAHFKKNNYKEAAKLMEKVIDMAPGEAISLDHLGDIYFALNRKREAKYFWIQAKDLAEPEDEIMEEINIKLNKFNAG